MIVGVDSSRSKGETPHILVAMTASVNSDFSKYTNKKIEIEEENKYSLTLPISTFIYESCLEFFKINKKLPGGIVIYRQGVSKEQRLYLNSEIELIDKLLSGQGEFENKLNIPYYYLLVNKKTSLKFFECEGITSSNKENLNESYNSKTTKNTSALIKPNFNIAKSGVKLHYENPDPGLLICNGITDSEIFEFYIQPQKVNQGTATPTNFHLAYGTMSCPELVYKLTYDLCYLYCNWRGPVRVPAPLKYAEKLAKVIPKLNDKTKNGLFYI